MPAPVSANDPARRRARASGAVKYEASYVCTADPSHGAIRYARNGMCCECAARARATAPANGSSWPARQARPRT